MELNILHLLMSQIATSHTSDRGAYGLAEGGKESGYRVEDPSPKDACVENSQPL